MEKKKFKRIRTEKINHMAESSAGEFLPKHSFMRTTIQTLNWQNKYKVTMKQAKIKVEEQVRKKYACMRDSIYKNIEYQEIC